VAPEVRRSEGTSEDPASTKWEALGTSVELRVRGAAALMSARGAVEVELAAIDMACSRFRGDSELSRLNERAGRWTRSSPLLIEALEVALRAAEVTGGDVDPTIGRELELAGYDRDWRELTAASAEHRPPPLEPIIARVRSGWRTIALDRASSMVRIGRGLRLDLGATAKAWAADRAALAAFDAAACGVLVSVGGDIATCGTAPPAGWHIRVTDDHRSDCSAPGQTISIRSGGLATSSTAVRRWSHGGQAMHHIIDPATGQPVRDSWRTASVAAADCTDANIAATAALVRGASAPAWLEQIGLPARLVDQQGNVTTAGSWP
jgi:FAD:protein FMN transferase